MLDKRKQAIRANIAWAKDLMMHVTWSKEMLLTKLEFVEILYLLISTS